MTPALTIRPYRPDDKSALLALLQRNVPEYFAPEEVADFSHYLDRETELYFVAENCGKLLGAGGINFGDNGQTAKISWDFVGPDFHGKGIGRELLQHRLEVLRSIGTVQKITVRTSQFAYRFYEKNGFTLKETQPDYWAKGFDLYAMTFEPQPKK